MRRVLGLKVVVKDSIPYDTIDFKENFALHFPFQKKLQVVIIV